jgi:hypothetical protein
MTGRPLVTHTPSAHNGLGIRSLLTSPNEKLIACAMYDNQLVLYNNLSQRQVCELDHVEKLQSPADKPTQTVIFEEKLSKDQN